MFIKYIFFYLCVGVLILLSSQLYHPVFYMFGLVYLGFLYSHFGIKITIIYTLTSLLFICLVQYPKDTSETTLSGTIVTIDEKYIVLKHDGAKIKIYGEFQEYHIDDTICVEVEYFDIGKVRNDNGFNYQRYLYSLGIKQQAYCLKIIDHSSNQTLFTMLQEKIEKAPSIKNYTSLFILGIKTQEIEEIYTSLTKLSVVHIFALSGMHIHILRRWLYNILRFFISEKYVTYVILFLIGIYLYAIPENISFMRAYLVMLIYTLGKKYLTKLDALAIACLWTVFKNPYVIYHISFIFSYLMYLFVILLGKYKHTGIILYLSSIPIILTLQYQIQTTAIFLAYFFNPAITILYSLCLWYVVFGQIMIPIIQVVIYVVESMIMLGNVLAVYLPFSKPPLFFVGIYYYLMGLILIKINKKRSYALEMCKIGCLLCVFFLISRYPIAGKIVMIDVGQGDSFLIKQPFNKGTILIDTGGDKKRDIASDTLIPYFRSEGITTLDYVFISHDDFDHCGALESLNEQMTITNIITSYQDPMQIGDVKITMYPLPLETRDSNANSLIFKVEVNGMSYLFTGDIGVEEEQLLYDTYGNIPVDVLKIPHHGSKNSTSYTLLHMTMPKLGLISCKENNMYHHPHDIVIDKLKRYGVHIYRSDQMGMVTIWYFDNVNYIFQ